MTDTTRLGLKILIAGAALGALADALLRATPWGINLPIWAAAFAAAVLALAPFRRELWRAEVIGFSRRPLSFRPRSPGGIQLSCFAESLCPDCHAFASDFARAGRKNSRRRVFSSTDSALSSRPRTQCSLRFYLVFKDIDWKEFRTHPDSARRWRVSRGILLAVPPVLIFGALLASADPVFDDLVTNRLHLSFADLPNWLGSFLLRRFFRLDRVGFLARHVSGKGSEMGKGESFLPSTVTRLALEVSIVLGRVDVLVSRVRDYPIALFLRWIRAGEENDRPDVCGLRAERILRVDVRSRRWCCPSCWQPTGCCARKRSPATGAFASWRECKCFCYLSSWPRRSQTDAPLHYRNMGSRAERST